MPEKIRGYGHVKMKNLAQADAEWDRLLKTFRDDAESRAAA